MVGILFLRRESLTLDELEKQLESSGPTLLPQYTRLQYEKRIKDAEAEAKPILESLAKSDGFKIIRQKELDKLKKFGPKFGDPEYIRLRKAAFAPLTLDEGISIEEPYILENIRTQLKSIGFGDTNLSDEQLMEVARSFNINTSSRLQQIKDSVADIMEKLRKDDELRKQMEEDSKREQEERERSFEESRAQLRETQSKRETVSSRLKRERREKTVARQKAQAEAEVKAKAQAEAKAQAQAKAQAEAEAEVKAKAKEEAEERSRVMAEARAQEQERIEQQLEEIAKIREARKEAEEAMNQLRQIPLEERIRRKIFVQPKMVHKPYPFVKSTPANPPYDTTKYEKRENLFKTSEISSIFPRPII